MACPMLCVQVTITKQRRFSLEVEPKMGREARAFLGNIVKTCGVRLTEGCYTFLYSPENGATWIGPDQGSANAMFQPLVQHMVVFYGQLEEAVQVFVFDEAATVGAFAERFVPVMIRLLDDASPSIPVPGFATFVVGDPVRGTQRFQDAQRLRELGTMEPPTDPQERDRLAKWIAGLEEDTLPHVTVFTQFMNGLSEEHPFAEYINREMQERLMVLAPSIERYAIALFRAQLKQRRTWLKNIERQLAVYWPKS